MDQSVEAGGGPGELLPSATRRPPTCTFEGSESLSLSVDGRLTLYNQLTAAHRTGLNLYLLTDKCTCREQLRLASA